MRTKFFLVGLLFLFVPLITTASSLPIIDLISSHELKAPAIYDSTFEVGFFIGGDNLNYIYNNKDQINPPAIKLGPFSPIKIEQYNVAPEYSDGLYVTFRVRADELQENQIVHLITYKANGDLIQEFDEDILIYDESFVLPIFTSVTPDFFGITSKKSYYYKTFILSGLGMNYIKNNPTQAKFGKAKSVSATGGDGETVDVTFKVRKKDFGKAATKRIRLYRDGQVIARSEKITIFNPYPRKYKDKKTTKFLENTNNIKLSKRTIGLNVHQALGATDDNESIYTSALKNSGTKWVREHISYSEFMGDEWRAWREKYDQIFKQYKKQNRRVVVMLAYGEDGSNKTPSEENWAKFIKQVTVRYKNHVDAWEVWNEPDLIDYHDPNTVDDILPMMRVAYPIIKDRAPNSIVLNGPVGNIRVTNFVSELYLKAGNYFDELSIHAYYCDEYRRDGNTSALISDFNDIANTRPSDKRNDKIWITELGCSMNTASVTEDIQKNYISDSSQALLDTGKVRNVFIYSIINRSDQGDYENNFGLLHEDGVQKKAWQWYQALPSK